MAYKFNPFTNKLDDVGSSSGTVTGPGSSTDNAVARFDGAGGSTLQNSGVIIDDSNNVTGIASITINNTGLKIKDTNASHNLSIVPGSDLSADRTLTLTTGDSDRTLTISGNTTLSGGTHSGTNTGDQTIQLTGDVTGSGTGSFAATIANDAVTYAKIQNVSATDKILGRSSSGAGDVEEIDCTAAGRALLDDANAAAQRTTLGLNATTRTIVLSAAGGWGSTTNGAAAATKVEYTTNDQDLQLMDFDQTTQEYAQWTIVMPDSYDGGTITGIFYWTAASGTGTVTWTLQGRSYADDEAIDQAWGTAQSVTDTLLATGDVHITSATAAVTLAGTPAGGELVQIRVSRDTSDTLNADARLIAVKLEYTTSTFSD